MNFKQCDENVIEWLCTLKEKVTPEIVFFLPSPIKRLYGVKLITEVSASKVHAIPRN